MTKRRAKVLTDHLRERHSDGIKRLKEAFGGGAMLAHYQVSSSIQHGATKLYRRRPGTQVWRDPWHRARHRRFKATRAARKRNRH